VPGYAPKWIITLAYDHVWELSGAATLTFHANSTFKSRYFTNFLNYRDSAQDAFTQTDASLEYAKGPVTVSVYVRNLENKRPLVQSYYIAAATDDIFNWQFGTPRTFGVHAGYKF
jgi:iron complex outermembrane receptor protein